jgi:hypothetical protein
MAQPLTTVVIGEIIFMLLPLGQSIGSDLFGCFFYSSILGHGLLSTVRLLLVLLSASAGTKASAVP